MTSGLTFLRYRHCPGSLPTPGTFNDTRCQVKQTLCSLFTFGSNSFAFRNTSFWPMKHNLRYFFFIIICVISSVGTNKKLWGKRLFRALGACLYLIVRHGSFFEICSFHSNWGWKCRIGTWVLQNLILGHPITAFLKCISDPVKDMVFFFWFIFLNSPSVFPDYTLILCITKFCSAVCFEKLFA